MSRPSIDQCSCVLAVHALAGEREFGSSGEVHRGGGPQRVGVEARPVPTRPLLVRPQPSGMTSV